MKETKKKFQSTAAQPNHRWLTEAEMGKVNASFSENALKMMKKRYLLTDDSGRQETPAEMFHRVAQALAQVEKKYGHDDKFVDKTEKEFFEILSKKEYTPAGRTLTNVGGPTPLVANCIVLPIMDSMESIFQTLKDAALLQQAGSGLGFDFSHLRPAMSPTKKSRGVSSGPVSFLKVYDAAFGTIKQQGRHGANMAMMDVRHLDILDFIRAKKIEGEIRNFNISVKLTDEFMKKLLESPDEKWLGEWNGQKMKPHKVLRAPNGSVFAAEEIDITVKEIFDEIVNYAWLNGEPGIVFIDEVNRTNPLPGLGPIDCSNPCVIGETLVATERGFIKMEELAESYVSGGIKISVDNRLPKAVKISSLNRISISQGGTIRETMPLIDFSRLGSASGEMLRAFPTGIKPVYKLTTKSGYELEATADHKIFTPRGKVPLLELRAGDKVLIQSNEGLWNNDFQLPFDYPNVIEGKNRHIYHYNFPKTWSKELGRVLGWLIGDGWLRDKKREYAVGFTFSEDDKEVMSEFRDILNDWYKNSERKEIKRKNDVYHLIYGSKDFVEFFKKLGVKPVLAAEKEVPASLWRAPAEAVSGFLQGIFSADGTINIYEKNQTRYIRLTSKSEKLLKQIQILLINFGIRSTIYNRTRKPRLAFGYKNDGILYELEISRDNIPIFLSKIGFLGTHYKVKAKTLKEKSYYREYFEDKIEKIKYIGKKRVYDLTEATTHSFIANGIIISNCGEQFLHHYDNCNLGSINLAAFVKDGRVDWGQLRRVTRIAARLMDNVIDIFDFPIQQVTDLARKNRRIGLGIMGFADMLYQLGIAYNSPEGQKLAEKTMRTITETAHQMSQELAKEKGAFPNLPLSVFAKKKIKMRNAALTTVAPTGSISMMLDCSSGVEPNFALSYVKQDKDGHQYHYFNRYFEQALKKYQFSEAKIKEIKDEIIKTGSIQRLTDLAEELRRTFVVAMDISAEDHIKMQASFQRYVDNSISKTINFPNSATKEDVFTGFVLAWKMKCKACTVYRDASREVQILNLGTGENIKAPTELGAKKSAEAPLQIPADKNRLEARQRPEVLTGKTYRMKTGYGNLYVTINNDEKGVPFEVFAVIGKSGGFFQEQSEGICRLISLSLRTGVKIEEIIDNLKGIRGPMPTITDKGTILSLPDAIGQILEEHARTNGGHNPLLQEHSPTEPMMLQEKEPANVAALPQSYEASKKSLADYGFMPGCPDCGAPLIMSEGCLSCRSCGFTRCF